MSEKIANASTADVGGIGAALRLVITDKGLRDKFTGVTRELEEAGYRSIQVTDTGFRLIRKSGSIRTWLWRGRGKLWSIYFVGTFCFQIVLIMQILFKEIFKKCFALLAFTIEEGAFYT